MHVNNNHEAAGILFPLLDLSPEIVRMVIEEIDEVQTFVSVSQTCSFLRSICRNERIVQNLFTSCHGGHKPEQQAVKIYMNLKFATRCSFLAPSSVEKAFREAWPLFRNSQMEEVLYPIAISLANLYFSRGLTREGKHFLERIWNFHEPYEVELSHTERNATSDRGVAAAASGYKTPGHPVHPYQQATPSKQFPMTNIDIQTELAALQLQLQDLSDDLNVIRLDIANASARARSLYQGVEKILDHLEAEEMHSPDAPVTPTCRSLPWGDSSTDFEDDADAEIVDGKEKTEG
ncbi:hypothetical protein FBEOM_5428 [Fusarium beomiforme]|uniref:F-box domain-containing protein n=1 Tax=Fusarium beomiforme TaxID=44412 RepID=A0A9P5AL87_9HYPO|nr:hypothetical protein FBEOM_5428 [Fusarium beomiforme]